MTILLPNSKTVDNSQSKRTVHLFQVDPRRHAGQQMQVPIYHQERTTHPREVGHLQQVADLQQRPHQEVPQQQVGGLQHQVAVTGDPTWRALKRLRSLLTAERNMKEERHRKYKDTSKPQKYEARSSSVSKRQAAKKRYKETVQERTSGSEMLPWVRRKLYLS